MAILALYKTKITPDRNAMVDEIENYLGSLTPTWCDINFQYQEIDLDIDVNAPIGDKWKENKDIGNYARLEQDNRVWYFFITDNWWVSEAVQGLHLSMDTINTFALGTDYTVSNKSTIIRKHKDRFKSYIGSPTTGYTLVRDIDKAPEGLSGLLKVRGNKQALGPSSNYLNQKWYIVYENDENTGYKYSLYPEDNVPVPIAGGTGSWYTAPATNAVNHYFTRLENNGLNLKIERDGVTTSFTLNDRYPNWTHILIQYDNNESCYQLKVFANGKILSASGYIYDDFELKYSRLYHYINAASDPLGNKNIAEVLAIADTTVFGADVLFFKTIDVINRINASGLINIIQCPYCPVNMTWTGNNLDEVDGFTIDTNEGTIWGNNTVISNEFELEIRDDVEDFLTLGISAYPDEDTMKRTARITSLVDSKMLNSEITTYKYGYQDSTSILLLENINTTNATTSVFNKIKYRQTNQLSSEKIFQTNIEINGNILESNYTHLEDYDDILFSNANHQIPLINSDYISYMRNGYNYDMKAKNRQTIGTWLGVTGGLAESLVGSLSRSDLSTAIVARGIKDTVSTFANAISSTAQLEASFQQKINIAKDTANSITNVNNIDLTNYYDKDKLYRYIYEPTQKQRTNIGNLFFYCGYAVNDYGTITNNNRYWFDYCKADVVFDNYNKFCEKFTDDIKDRWSKGVTNYHCHKIDGTKYWDWNQANENWENNFFNI